MLKRGILALVAFAVAATFAGVVGYWAAITISPAHVVGDDGVVHPTMPIGQCAVGILVGGLVGLLAAIAAARKKSG